MNDNYNFYIEDYITELKQHINLSDKAWLTIYEDIRNFYDTKEKESFSGFLNRIYRNYYQKSTATISLRCSEKKEELENIFSNIKLTLNNKNSISFVINEQVLQFENSLIEKMRSFQNGMGVKFRINKENLSILRDSMEAKYYDGSIGLYLKALYEDYSSNYAFLREQIFFADTYNVITSAILSKNKVKITLADKLNNRGEKITKKFYISPYKIVQDRTNTFNYVIGFSEEIQDIIIEDKKNKIRKTSIVKEKQISCFRLSRIVKADIQSSMRSHISKEKAREIDKMILERDVMFMSSEPIEIKIQFTEKGVNNFKRWSFMRPQFYNIDIDNPLIYNFKCTEVQAINYFWKFGWDAVILSPNYLYKSFKKRYERSYKSYVDFYESQFTEETK